MQYSRRRVCTINNIHASHVSRLYNVQLSEDGSNFFESVLQVSIEDPWKSNCLYWIHHSSLIIRLVTYFTYSFKVRAVLIIKIMSYVHVIKMQIQNVHVSRMSHLHHHKHAMNNEWYRQVSINSTVHTVQTRSVVSCNQNIFPFVFYFSSRNLEVCNKKHFFIKNAL